MKITRFIPQRWTSALVQSLFFLSLIVLTQNSCGPTPPPPPPEFQINIDSVSNPTPNLNDLYTITWSYAPADRFEDQFVELQSLSIDGNLLRTFFGCPPPEFRPAGLGNLNDCGQVETLPCPNTSNAFTNNCRSFVQQFTGPVVVSISAKDHLTGDWKRKSVTLKIANSSFKTGSIEPSNTGYPSLGLDSQLKELDFMKYFAIFNNDRSKVVIEGLNAPPISGAFAADRPFFATSTRVEEAQNFGFTLGRNFPILDPGFLETADGQRYISRRTHSDAIIFAGTIALSGNIETKEVKTDNGTVTITVVTQLPVTVTPPAGPSSSFFPEQVLFIQIDLADSLANVVPVNESMTASNVKFGNVGQGLVMPTFGGEITPVVPAITNSQISLVRGSNNIVGSTNGDIGGAGVAFQITRLNGDLLLPAAVQITNISWRNVPAVAGNNMGLLLGQH